MIDEIMKDTIKWLEIEGDFNFSQMVLIKEAFSKLQKETANQIMKGAGFKLNLDKDMILNNYEEFGYYLKTNIQKQAQEETRGKTLKEIIKEVKGAETFRVGGVFNGDKPVKFDHDERVFNDLKKLIVMRLKDLLTSKGKEDENS